MESINKQKTGFKFGVNRTKLLRSCGEFVGGQGKRYQLVVVEADGKPYYSIRLYNPKGKFLKQLMFDLDSIHALCGLLYRERELITTNVIGRD